MTMWDLCEDKFYSIAFFCAGIFSFFYGFMRLRRKRMVENIPTSTVRGLAMGLVELTGTARAIAKDDVPFKGPLSGVDCAYFNFNVSVRVRRGRDSYWESIAKGSSAEHPFWLIDETGKVPVLPKDAEIDLNRHFEHRTWGEKNMPVRLLDFLYTYALERYRGRELLFTEYHIKEGQKVYVLGTAMKRRDFLDEYKEALVNRLYELKTNPVKRAAIDTNKDGQISPEEWDRAVAKIEEELAKEGLQRNESESHDVIIAKGDTERLYMISDSSQKDLIGQLSFETNFFIFGGAALALYTFWSIFNYIRARF